MSSEAFAFGKHVWICGKEEEKNLSCSFKTFFTFNGEEQFTLKLTGSTLYRIILNNQFLGYGPARAHMAITVLMIYQFRRNFFQKTTF